MIEPPETEYTETDDGADIAYQVCGDGPPDLVFERGIGSHVELAWEIAAWPGCSGAWRRSAA